MTLDELFAELLRNDPRIEIRCGAPLARGIFLAGVQAALMGVQTRCPNGPVKDDVVGALEAVNEEVGDWLRRSGRLGRIN